MRIAVLEDDAVQVEMYRLWLGSAHHEMAAFCRMADFTRAASEEVFDLALVDRGLPDGSGEMALSFLRERLGSALPVIFVTARNAEADVVAALRQGADDYIVKPARCFELLARIDALLRRAQPPRAAVTHLGAWRIDRDNREILYQGRVIELTHKEFELACYLFDHPGRLLSRVHLLEAIWGLQAQIDTRTVDTHMSRLRRKLAFGPDTGWDIVSVYGYGYRMERSGAVR